MPREWTERHIRELVDVEYKALGGGSGDVSDKYIWSLDIPIFAHADGGAVATLKRLTVSDYELTMTFPTYANVVAGDTFFFIPDLGLESHTSNVLYIPPMNYFFSSATTITHTVTELTYTNLSAENLDFQLYGLPTWTCDNAVTDNSLRYTQRNAGLYCEAVNSFLLTASTPGKIVSKIKLKLS